jgi:hypothetical protein
MPARLARALQVNALFRSESSAHDKGAASLRYKTTLCDVPGLPCSRGPVTPGVLRQRVPVNGEAFRTKFLYLEGTRMLHDTQERSEARYVRGRGLSSSDFNTS